MNSTFGPVFGKTQPVLLVLLLHILDNGHFKQKIRKLFSLFSAVLKIIQYTHIQSKHTFLTPLEKKETNKLVCCSTLVQILKV